MGQSISTFSYGETISVLKWELFPCTGPPGQRRRAAAHSHPSSGRSCQALIDTPPSLSQTEEVQEKHSENASASQVYPIDL